jgi:hypothetical protein
MKLTRKWSPHRPAANAPKWQRSLSNSFASHETGKDTDFIVLMH